MAEQLDNTKLDTNEKGLNNGQSTQPQNGVADNNGNGTVGGSNAVPAGSNTNPANDHTDGTDEKAVTPKKVISKKFHQEAFESSNGNKYPMTFPGTQKMMKLQSDCVTDKDTHEMYMDKILEGQFDYKYFDKLHDVNLTKEIKVAEDDGTEKIYHLDLKSFETIEEFGVASIDQFGRPSDYLGTKFALSNFVKEDVDYDYFDEHNGFGEINKGMSALYKNVLKNSEYYEVMNGVTSFLAKMFR